MPLTKIEIDEIKKDAEVYSDGFFDKNNVYHAYIAGAGSEREKAKVLAIGVMDWLADVNMNGVGGKENCKIILCDGEYYWEADTEGDQPISSEKLFELYNNTQLF